MGGGGGGPTLVQGQRSKVIKWTPPPNKEHIQLFCPLLRSIPLLELFLEVQCVGRENVSSDLEQ